MSILLSLHRLFDEFQERGNHRRSPRSRSDAARYAAIPAAIQVLESRELLTNQPPTIMPGNPSFQVTHDQSITMPLPMGMDPNGDPLTAQLVGGVSNGTLTLNGNNTFTYTPSYHYVGTDSFQLRYVDPYGAASNVATVSLNVVNAPPTTMPGNPTYQVTHDQSITMPLPMGMDPNGDPLTLQLVSNVSQGTLTLNSNNTFTYTPAYHYVGTDSFQVRYVDPLGAASAPVTVTMNVVNAPPTTMPGQPVYQLAHDRSITMPLPMGMDPNGDPLTLQLVSNVSQGTLTLNGTSTFTYTPGFHYVGTDSFQVRFVDPLGAVSPIVTVSLNVTNATPVFMTSPGTVSVAENTPIGTVVVNSMAMDADDTSLMYAITSGNDAGYFFIDGAGAIKVASNLDYDVMPQRQFTLTVQAVDSLGATATRTITVNVTNVDEPPVLQNFNVTTTDGYTFLFTGRVVDDFQLGCHVKFGGLLAGLQVACDTGGNFAYSATLDNLHGPVIATGYDLSNQPSNNAVVFI